MAITKAYKIEIDGQQANATVGQIKQEVERLEAELEGLQLGSLEADRVVAELGKAKAALKNVDEAVDVAFDKDRAGAFVDAISGVAGAFEVGTVAAVNFGLLSTEGAEKYQQKLTEMIAVVQGLEQVHKLTTSEVRTALSGVLGSIKTTIAGYFGMGTAATTSAGITRAALVSTGLGAFIVLLGIIIVNWDKISGAVNRNRTAILGFLSTVPAIGSLVSLLTTIEQKFGGISQLVSGLGSALKEQFSLAGDVLAALLQGDVTGALDEARKIGQRTATAFNSGVAEKNAELAEEQARTEAAARADGLKRQIAEQEAAGKDVYALKKQLLQDEILLLDKSASDYNKLLADKQSEIRTLTNAHNKQLADESEKARKEEADKAKAAAEKSKKDLEERLQKEREARAKARAQLESDQQFEVNLLSAQGKETLDVQIQQLAERLKNNKRASEEERDLYTKDNQALILLRAQRTKREEDLDAEAISNRQEARGQELTAEKEFQKNMTSAISTGVEDLKKKTTNLSLGDTILTRIFGVGEDQLEDTKARLQQSMQLITDAAFQLNDLFFSGQQERIDAQIAGYEERISLIQERGKTLDDELDDARKRREEAEKNIAGATGARREALIAKVAKEQAAETRLAREKAKNAKEEQAALKQKEEAEKRKQALENKSRILQEATTVSTQAATAATAVQAGVEAVKQGSKIPFPANVAAVIAALAAVAATIAGAKKLGATFKGAEGGLLEGPSHALGGIRGSGTFANVEVEGREMLIRRSATENNLSTLATINKYGARVQFAAVPRALLRGATGGQLTDAGGLEQEGGSAGVVTVPAAQFDKMVGLLEQIAGHTQASANKEPFLFDGPTNRRIVDSARREQQDADGGKLFG